MFVKSVEMRSNLSYIIENPKNIQNINYRLNLKDVLLWKRETESIDIEYIHC